VRLGKERQHDVMMARYLGSFTRYLQVEHRASCWFSSHPHHTARYNPPTHASQLDEGKGLPAPPPPKGEAF